MNRTWFSSLSQHKKSLIFAFAATLLASLVSPEAQASRNGVEEPGNTFTVGITFKFGTTDQLCSGAMLTPTIVVTAGHCAYSTQGEKGTNYIFTPPGTPIDAAIDPRIVQPKVIKIFTDPSFSTLDSNNLNDLAFLQLDKAFKVKKYLTLATESEFFALNDASVVAGYGYGKVFETGIGYSIYPRKYQLNWRTMETTTADTNTFNVMSTTATACKGDSGGPIVTTLASGKEVLVGVLSGASLVENGCGTAAVDGNFYLRMTKAYPFLPLIKTIYDPKTGMAPVKKITIKCKKGSVIKKVTALKPTCPRGYIKVK